jgi:hypothetical protein
MVNLFAEILTMGEEKAEATGAEASPLIVEPAVSEPRDAQNGPGTTAEPQAPEKAEIASPALVPEQDSPAELSDAAAPAPKPTPKPTPKSTPKPEEPIAREIAQEIKNEIENASQNEPAQGPQAPEASAGACDETKAEASQSPGQFIVVPFGDPAFEDNAASERDAAGRNEFSGMRRYAAMAAIMVLGTGAGAFGGALATAAFFHGTELAGGNPALEASIARIDADILALKASLEFGSKLGQSQYNKTSERLDKIEKAQGEPAARLARLSEAVDKLRAAPVPLPAPVPAAARDVTGSVSPASPQAAAKTDRSDKTDRTELSKPENSKPENSKSENSKSENSKTEVARLPTLEGWVLRDVARGGALIDGRRGMYEVYAGDYIPGLGRIDAIRRQDGHWVVVTSKGLIVPH